MNENDIVKIMRRVKFLPISKCSLCRKEIGFRIAENHSRTKYVILIDTSCNCVEDKGIMEIVSNKDVLEFVLDIIKNGHACREIEEKVRCIVEEYSY